MAVINIANPFFSQVVLGAEEAAQRAGYDVIVGNSYDSNERESRYLELFERQRLDGVLIAPVGNSLRSLDRFRERGVPVVLVDRIDKLNEFTSVSLDDVLGGTMAAEHLLENGRRHIGFIGGPFHVTQMTDRLEGSRRVVEGAGARFTVFETSTLNPTLGRELGESIANLPPADRPDAIFAANDEMALGVMQSLMRRGIRIPEDIAIVGYDDIDFAAAAIVPLTSVRQPSFEMGSRAAELLVQKLGGDDSAESSRFLPELIVRQSTRK